MKSTTVKKLQLGSCVISLFVAFVVGFQPTIIQQTTTQHKKQYQLNRLLLRNQPKQKHHKLYSSDESSSSSSSSSSPTSPENNGDSKNNNNNNAENVQGGDNNDQNNDNSNGGGGKKKEVIVNGNTSSLFPPNNGGVTKKMNRFSASITKMLMMSFILSMCIALPVTLLPQRLLPISKTRKERLALLTGKFCARWLLRIFPFCNIQCTSDIANDDKNTPPEPTVWVCNHTSMLDVFLLMASDRKMRGKNNRPIKIIYWKQLEDNYATKILFQQSGFIPVDMKPNKAGEDNQYDMKSFKNMLKLSKQAFEEGFDLGILPEGQLNPTPEKGLMPVFGGAFTLARMSKRPIKFLALNGAHNLWHPDESIGMTVTSRKIKIRAYGDAIKKFTNADEFVSVFSKVVGYFGAYGEDIPNVQQLLDGTAASA